MSTEGQGEWKVGSAGGEHCHVEVTCVLGLVQRVDGQNPSPKGGESTSGSRF